MNTNGYNCKNTKDCDQCQKVFNMPFSYCCLDECGEYEFCRGCNHGIYENDSKEMKNKRKEETISNMSRGIKTVYRIDKEYFEVGSAYQIKTEENKYVNAMCTNLTEGSVRFVYVKDYKTGEIGEFVLTLLNLIHNVHDIVKLSPNYEEGKFKFINVAN